MRHVAVASDAPVMEPNDPLDLRPREPGLLLDLPSLVEPDERPPAPDRAVDAARPSPPRLPPPPSGGLKRVDLPCGALGFEAPPCAVHLRFVRTGPEWTLVVRAPPGRPNDVARWLAPHRPALTRVEPGLAPKRLHAVFEEVPAAWSAWLTGLSVRFLDLRPEGAASLWVDGGDVEAFAADVGDARVRRASASPDPDVLTSRQREAMSLAVALGYYEVPHRVDLRTLARRMGLSLGATSELLRRGQSAIVHNFFDVLAARRWTDDA